MVGDSHQRLRAVLAEFLGRDLRTAEIARALGVSRSAYYLAGEQERLITGDNLLKLASALGINPVTLLVRFGIVTRDEVLKQADESGD